MKGLLTKDFRLLLQRKQFFLVMLIISFFLAMNSADSFVVGYLVVLMAIFAISTISYDEYDNCFAYLMTMPVNSKLYVLEKFLFGGILAASAWVFSIVLQCVANAMNGKEYPIREMMGELTILLLVGGLILSFGIAIQLKFGGEKSRVVMLIIGGAVFAAALGINRFFAEKNLAIPEFVTKLDQLPESSVMVGAFILTAAVVFGCIQYCIRVMDKKEY